MRRGAWVALAAGALGASGCALFEKPGAPAAPASAAPAFSIFAPAAPAADGARELVAYLDRLRGLGEPAIAAEATRARQAAGREASDLARVKAAIALSLSPNGDEGDIMALVDPVVRRDGNDPGVKVMASFLQANALERRRLKESAATARATLREERRALEAQRQRAESLQERAAQLQQKIDALTELEKSLSDRQAPSR